MTCAIPLCMYVKFDIANARLELVSGGVVKAEAKLRLMPGYNGYVQRFNEIRAALARHINQPCEAQCHCAKVNPRPNGRNLPAPLLPVDQGTLPDGKAWEVRIVGVTFSIWMSPCLPDGAKIWDGKQWKQAETWGPGWDPAPMDPGGSSSSGGKKKKGGKKKRGGKKPMRRR
jgi:hypothetical protein